jgi:tRNA-binding EMAP/Myf-like protein
LHPTAVVLLQHVALSIQVTIGKIAQHSSACSRGTGIADDLQVGKILSLEPVPGKDKLKKVMVDVGGTEPVRIVTNAGNVKQSDHVVVALVGAVIGGHEDGEEVKKTTVGGVISHGMLCDGPMLGWGPGNKGRAAVLPESFAVGSFAPSSKPRGD